MNTGNNMYSTLLQSSEQSSDRFTWNAQNTWNSIMSCNTVKVVWTIYLEIAFHRRICLLCYLNSMKWISANVLQTVRVHWRVPVLFILRYFRTYFQPPPWTFYSPKGVKWSSRDDRDSCFVFNFFSQIFRDGYLNAVYFRRRPHVPFC